MAKILDGPSNRLVHSLTLYRNNRNRFCDSSGTHVQTCVQTDVHTRIRAHVHTYICADRMWKVQPRSEEV